MTYGGAPCSYHRPSCTASNFVQWQLSAVGGCIPKEEGALNLSLNERPSSKSALKSSVLPYLPVYNIHPYSVWFRK